MSMYLKLMLLIVVGFMLGAWARGVWDEHKGCK